MAHQDGGQFGPTGGRRFYPGNFLHILVPVNKQGQDPQDDRNDTDSWRQLIAHVRGRTHGHWPVRFRPVRFLVAGAMLPVRFGYIQAIHPEKERPDAQVRSRPDVLDDHC